MAKLQWALNSKDTSSQTVVLWYCINKKLHFNIAAQQKQKVQNDNPTHLSWIGMSKYDFLNIFTPFVHLCSFSKQAAFDFYKTKDQVKNVTILACRDQALLEQ